LLEKSLSWAGRGGDNPAAIPRKEDDPVSRRYLFRRRRPGEILWSALRLSGIAVLAFMTPAAAAAAPFLR
jgi:hypothetical protein